MSNRHLTPGRQSRVDSVSTAISDQCNLSNWLPKPSGILAIVLLGLALLSACASNSGPEVTICDTATPTENCTESQNEFSVGQRLSAHLAADEPFAVQSIIGKILRLTDTDTIPLGARIISPEPNQRSIVQTLPFHEFGAQAEGNFLVQFVDENDRLIAEKAFTIR